jgi:outer membrane protein assembly factor BamB
VRGCRLLWHRKLDHEISDGIAGCPGGPIVAVSGYGRLTVVSDEGDNLWDFYGASDMPMPVCDRAGFVYCVDNRGQLRAMDGRGDTVWTFDAPQGQIVSLALGRDSLQVMVTYQNGRIQAVGCDDGLALWTAGLEGPITGAVAGAEGSLIACARNGAVSAISPQGNPLWTQSVGEGLRILAPPATDDAGNSFILCESGEVVSYSQGGQWRWTHATDERLIYRPAVSPNGDLYVAGGATVFCIGLDGRRHWMADLGAAIYAGPVAGADGKVLLGCMDGSFWALAPQGNVAWKFSAPSTIIAADCDRTTGLIYLADTSNRIYALRERQ